MLVKVMQFSEVLKKLTRCMKEPPFLLLQSALHKVSFARVSIHRLYLLEYRGIPQINTRSVRGPGYIREAGLKDVDEMGELENKHELLRQRFLENDYGAVAIVDGKIVAYSWFSDKAVHLEARYRYRIPIPLDSMYGYDLYIHPKYRMSGLWIKFMMYWADLMRQNGRSTMISMIDYGNTVSMNTHTRFGFRAFKDVYVVSIFGNLRHIECKM